MDKPREKGDENTACRALLCARRPVTHNHRSGNRRLWLVLARGNRAVRFVCTGGSVRATPGPLSIRRCRARALDCHGFVPVVGSADLPTGAGNPATRRPRLGGGIGDLSHRGDCLGYPGCDIETASCGRSQGGVALGRQSSAAGRGLRHRLCPVLSGLRVDYLPVFHERLLPRCASAGCQIRRLVLGDPNWTRRADDFGRASGDSHLADEPGASGHRRGLDNVGGRRCRASSVAESLHGPNPSLGITAVLLLRAKQARSEADLPVAAPAHG